MIYTVTFNPTVDYVMYMNDVVPGVVNRTEREEVFFGGKGINVSTVLRNMDVDSVALGFTAGFTGDAIEQNLERKGIKTEFIKLDNGLSRINVKIKAKDETDINCQGPEIPEDAVEKLFYKLEKLKSGDVLVLAGSIPNTLSNDIYERIMQNLDGSGADIFVDATGDLLVNVLKYKPFLIKPNTHELGEIFGVQIDTDDDIVKYANKLRSSGARNILVSRAGDGSILVSETNEIIKMGVPQGRVLNSVGAGDSMVAGFIIGYKKTGDYNEALKLGTACGSATAFSSGLAERPLVERLLEEFKEA